MQEDIGPRPFVTNIEDLTLENDVFRRAIWTGPHLQITLMNIPVDGEVGLEVHPETDQFLRVEGGTAKVLMGRSEQDLSEEWKVEDGYAIVVPAGTWHNIINISQESLKLYSIYAPAHHPHGTVHTTKADADAAEAQE